MHASAINKILERFDEFKGELEEHDVSRAIEEYARAHPELKNSQELLAEGLAFAFYETEPDEDGDHVWFCPLMSGVNKDGSKWESPSPALITADTLKYWNERAEAARHPVLKTRYAGLVWQYNKKVTGSDPGADIARICIQSILQLAAHDGVQHESAIFLKLAQALRIAVCISDRGFIEQVKTSIIDYESRTVDNAKPGTWTNAFDLLVGNKKVLLTDGELKKIISSLESHLERTSVSKGGSQNDAWGAEHIARRLARYYRKLGQQPEIHRVLSKVERAFGPLLETAMPLLAQAWLKTIHDLYAEFGLDEEASRIRTRIRVLGPNVLENMKTTTHTMEITKDEMDGFVNAFLEGDAKSVLHRFIGHYIPRKEKIVPELRKLAKQFPLSNVFQKQMLDHDGRPIVCIGSLEVDIDGRIAEHIAQDIGLHSIFMARVIDAMIPRFEITTNAVLRILAKSPVFEKSKLKILRAGLDAYFEKNWMISLHLLVPQIEAFVRSAATQLGVDVYRPNRVGGMDLRSLNELLNEDVVSKALLPDFVLYLRALLCDPKGINLRNSLCHGMLPSLGFTRALADRVFHVFLFFSIIRAPETSAKS